MKIFPNCSQSERKATGKTQRSLEMEEGNQELKNEKGKKTDFCKASRKATGVLCHHDVIPVRPAADSRPIPAKKSGHDYSQSYGCQGSKVCAALASQPLTPLQASLTICHALGFDFHSQVARFDLESQAVSLIVLWSRKPGVEEW